ncbi:MAG: rod shape-determining protein MreD [Prevotella sp.]|nr:rod shape-determining protein MreD [Prevotella sp.]
MSVDFFKRLGWFFVLCLVQVLILNHIHLFDVAIPLLYVYFTITFQRSTPKWMILLWSFALGLAIDVFSNTPGLASGSMTLIAVIQPYLLEIFVPRDSAENLEVSISTLGFSKFLIFCVILLVVYCLVFFALEAFSFFNWQYWLMCAGASLLLTLALIMAIESVRRK